MHRSTLDLAGYLADCDPSECFAVLNSMRSSLSPDSEELCERFASRDAIGQLDRTCRVDLAGEMVRLLAWYGSDTIAYAARAAVGSEPGVSYGGVLLDVARTLNAQLEKDRRVSIPRVATASEFEDLIVQLVLGVSFKGKTPEGIAALLEECGVGRDDAAAVAKKYIAAGVRGIAVAVLVRMLGKRVVQQIVETVIVSVVARVLSKEAAQILAKRLVAQASQKALAAWMTAVAIVWTALDVTLLMSSPATRITVPTVTLIASCRVRHRLEQG